MASQQALDELLHKFSCTTRFLFYFRCAIKTVPPLPVPDWGFWPASAEDQQGACEAPSQSLSAETRVFGRVGGGLSTPACARTRSCFPDWALVDWSRPRPLPGQACRQF